MANLSAIQEELRQNGLDGWLLYDFRGSNPIAYSVLEITSKLASTSRRWAVYIPANGEVTKIVNAIERDTIGSIQAQEIVYSTRHELENSIRNLVTNKRIAVEYSPNNSLPYISKLDAGTADLLRSFGAELISSGDIVQKFSAVWSQNQFVGNKRVARELYNTMFSTLQFIRTELLEGRTVTECSAQDYIMNEFEKRNLTTYHAANVSVNANAANPHYDPQPDSCDSIKQGDVLLIDMWAKGTEEYSVYSDITWIAYVGETVPDHIEKVFSVIRDARNAVVSHIRNLSKIALSNGTTPIIRGCELDDISRSVITNAGYGNAFFHRTGHNIFTETHGPGAHLDNYETEDTRSILPMTSFSVEPGIYLTGEFGMRTEIDVIIDNDWNVIVPGICQETVIPLLTQVNPISPFEVILEKNDIFSIS